jgi:hypothetical protein
MQVDKLSFDVNFQQIVGKTDNGYQVLEMPELTVRQNPKTGKQTMMLRMVVQPKDWDNKPNGMPLRGLAQAMTLPDSVCEQLNVFLLNNEEFMRFLDEQMNHKTLGILPKINNYGNNGNNGK